MTFILKWAGAEDADRNDILSSDSPITDPSSTSVLATVAGDATYYLDTRPSFDTERYYVVASFRGSDVSYSKSIKAELRPDTGPGPQTIAWGDLNLGFFGEVPDYVLGISANMWTSGNTGSTGVWYKIIRKGRIMYVAYLYQVAATVATLQQRGLWSNGVIPAYSGSTDTGNNITIEGRNFALRISKMFDYANAELDLTKYNMSAANNYPFGISETMDFSRMMLSTLSATTVTPFSLARHAAPSNASYPLITSDYSSSAKTSVVAFPSLNLATPNMGATTAALTVNNGCAFAVVEYKGLK